MQIFIKYMIELFVFVVKVMLVISIYNIPFIIYFSRKTGKKVIDVKNGTNKGAWKKWLLVKILWYLPVRYWKDFFSRDPYDFNEYGMIIFTGRQGYGKTVAMTEFIMRLQQYYKKSKVITNYGYLKQDAVLNHWRMLTDYNNGRLGIIAALDELQNWFNSLQSKDFPPEMLSVVTQNRKNRRLICGTAQQFYMLAKNIRTQCTEVRKCNTFLNCFTVVRRYQLEIDNTGEVKSEKFSGIYCFVHSDELRESYDTYKVINSLVDSGFQPQPLQQDVLVNVLANVKGKKK